MIWLLLLGLAGCGAYVYHDTTQVKPVLSGNLVPAHWYRVLWDVSGPTAAAGNPVAIQAGVQAAMVAQGFTGALAVLAGATPQPDGSWAVTATGPYVVGPGTLVGVPGTLTLGTIVEVNPPAGSA